MNPIKIEHLKANIDYWKIDILMSSARFLEKMDESWLVKGLSASKQAKLIFDMVRDQQNFTKENIDELINYKVTTDKKRSRVQLKVFVNPVFFQTQELVKNPSADAKKKIRHVFHKIHKKGLEYEPTTEQRFIDNFEHEFKKLYTHDFHGEITENDGKQLYAKS
jgi:hypothetical protein